MTSLVLAEHDNARLNEATGKTVGAASKLGGDVHVLVAGKGASAVAAEGWDVGLLGAASANDALSATSRTMVARASSPCERFSRLARIPELIDSSHRPHGLEARATVMLSR